MQLDRFAWSRWLARAWAGVRARGLCWWWVAAELAQSGPKEAVAEWLQRFRYGKLTGRWLKLWFWSIGGDDGRPPPGAPLNGPEAWRAPWRR